MSLKRISSLLFHCCSQDDRKNNKVPESFPGTIMVSLKPDSEKWHVHEEYRTSEEPTDEFRYFVERIMPAIAPGRNKFKERKGKKLLSEIYTVTDEAFGLLMLLNELHCWEESAKKQESDRYGKKRFCDGRSGNKKGWSNRGIKIYNRLCKNVHRRRQQEESKNMEIYMYRDYSRNNKSYRDNSSDESSEDDESTYNDDAILDNTEKLKNKTKQAKA